MCDMIEGRHGLLSLLDEVSSYKDNDGAVLVNRYNRAMGTHDHYFPGQEAVYGTGYAREQADGVLRLFFVFVRLHPIPEDGCYPLLKRRFATAGR